MSPLLKSSLVHPSAGASAQTTLWVRNQSQKQIVEQPSRPSIHIARRITEEIINEGAGFRINGDGLPLRQEAESQGPIVKPFIASAFPDAYPLTSPCLARATAGFRDTHLNEHLSFFVFHQNGPSKRKFADISCAPCTRRCTTCRSYQMRLVRHYLRSVPQAVPHF